MVSEGEIRDVNKLLDYIYEEFSGAEKKYVIDMVASALLTLARDPMQMSPAEVVEGIMKGELKSSGGAN